MMEIIIYALRNYITYVLLSICGVICVFLRKSIKEMKKRNSLLHQSVNAILRNDIIAMYNECVKKGYCPIYVKENVKSLSRLYHDLGGNGVSDKLVQELLEMPSSKGAG